MATITLSPIVERLAAMGAGDLPSLQLASQGRPWNGGAESQLLQLWIGILAKSRCAELWTSAKVIWRTVLASIKNIAAGRKAWSRLSLRSAICSETASGRQWLQHGRGRNAVERGVVGDPGREEFTRNRRQDEMKTPVHA